jgi:hypothetical protein
MAGIKALATGDRQSTVAAEDRLVAMGIRNTAAFSEVGNAEGIRRNVDQHSVHFVPSLSRGQHAGAQSDAQVGMNVFPWN